MDEEFKFTTDEGYEYLVIFQEHSNYSSIFGIKIIDVSIILMNEEIEYNSYKSLIEFIKIINNYLVKEENVILYYYCDISPIKMRIKRKVEMSPQQFRNQLFVTMFERSKSENFVSRQIIVKDIENGDHYTSLITDKINESKLENIIKELESLLKK
ncbi:hypothetical protein [Chryseobacterium sp. Leaf394]|uniref:hypothetical protein n=1 Tax=Chryseobacterium sp. Leaf394 TaxID=1736361 RepID=UPI0006FDAC5E|nr:hypothetical protein [Chryseobacterium sp. Leaf394]KQS91553.1 hypothetical protein ASG21_03525 [Chryseobacterium sp. Leaf394]